MHRNFVYEPKNGAGQHDLIILFCTFMTNLYNSITRVLSSGKKVREIHEALVAVGETIIAQNLETRLKQVYLRTRIL